MPLRRRLSPAELLELIASNGGTADVRAARRLLALADTVQCQQIRRQASISVRLVAPERILQHLTLYLVHDTGLVTVWYTRLWQKAGIPARVAREYDRAWARAVGMEVLERGVPASQVVKRWKEIELLVATTTAKLTHYLIGPTTTELPATRTLGALEGVLREVTTYQRSRSKRLRDEALRRAAGRCECCDVIYGPMLGSRGSRVLEVHHLHQLALRDAPALTKAEQLAVVCANCHLLIHADIKNAMTIGSLRSLWRKERSLRS